MRGAGGALADAGRGTEVPSYEVDVVDTTGAGDAFCGAFAATLSQGEDLQSAVRWGCAAGALSCTKLGAEPALPHRAAIESLVRAVSR